MNNPLFDKTICAPATVQGTGAIAVIRVSGNRAFEIVDKVFVSRRGDLLTDVPGYSLRYGSIFRGKELLDEVIVSVFKAPASFTGENTVEISCHGSNYIVSEILALLLENGAKMASPGEFTQRAFINGKMDLAQAEAVADLIASQTASAHKLAISQMKGGFSKELASMREQMLHIVSLMELELDFSEEEVEFADRKELNDLLDKVLVHIGELTSSFKLGNVIKNGVPVAIAGATNTGKSTLLNALLGEEKAIVSPIHGTTRDAIEDTINIDGILFRFIDTAGIRSTKGTIESIGIERSFEKIRQASVVLMMLDGKKPDSFNTAISTLSSKIDNKGQKVVILINKCDTINGPSTTATDTFNMYSKMVGVFSSIVGLTPLAVLNISAKQGVGLDKLKDVLIKSQQDANISTDSVLVTNLRHYEALANASAALIRVREGLCTKLPTDLLTQDLREALYHIGTIVGEISTEEVLGNIFKNF
ncbi:MAG: tRNA uridine-5-carboxymethylaminomethyl(34) synthesis GTPase MnmE, partial [Bacteroidales bacterium]|nr:tRNA uridine-5-carboxymethylaminomethyl(34) synthesis GTPase MnmE [Bacteroidales bacterium]